MASIALASPPASERPALLTQRVPAAVLLAGLVGWLLLDLLLLCRFLGLAQPLVYAGWTILSGGLFWLLTLPRRRDLHAGPTLATLLICLGIGVIVMLLGGEGRLFYANVDWQVRDAVLREMSINPWPFAYASGEMLRAPLGMYLVPALAGKLWGPAGADFALLGQNSLLFGVVLAIGSTLFADRRRRLIALALFLAFSGLDILGQIKAGHGAGLTPTAHIEGWGPTQFSSTLTLAFWVPQHAMAGWIGALAILLWRVGRLPLGALLMLPPLLALWSPLAALGLLPFLLHAAWVDVRGKRITLADFALPSAACGIALPSLVYLSAAGDAVGVRLYPIRPDVYLTFLTIEIIPYLLVARAGRHSRFGGATLAIATISLLVVPLIQIGWSIDFAMRASIPALAILALHLADGLGGEWAMSAARRTTLLFLLAIGSVTGFTEIARAVTFPVADSTRCGFARSWDQTFSAWPKDSYLAPLSRVPEAIRPLRETTARPDPVGPCFPHGWQVPALF